jgi:hypothetical protein
MFSLASKKEVFKKIGKIFALFNIRILENTHSLTAAPPKEREKVNGKSYL